MELCGHATLATAYVIMRFAEPSVREVSFDTQGGVLTVKKDRELLVMDFPSFTLTPVEVTVVPFWAKELRKNELTAYQASARGGILYCRYAGERTVLSGKAALFSESRIYFEKV